AIGLFSSVIAHVTALSGRGSGRPPGPTGLATTRPAAAPVGPPAPAPMGVVVFSQPASTPTAPSPTAEPAAPRSSWRRVRPDRSLGWPIGEASRFNRGPDREVKE